MKATQRQIVNEIACFERNMLKEDKWKLLDTTDVDVEQLVEKEEK